MFGVDMTTATESATTPFEQMFENVGKAAESAIKMQQDLFDQWTKMWPGPAQAKADWAARAQKFQKEWASTISELLRKQQSVWDEQYRAGIESFEETFQLASSKDPAELRERCESLFRKTMDTIKAMSEMQARHFQEAMQKWVELCQTKA
jgi:hypothetical protein